MSRFELGEDAVVDGEVAVDVVAEKVVLEKVVVQEDVGVVADVELAVGVKVWLDSLVGLEDGTAEEEADEMDTGCLTVDDTSAVSSDDFIGVEGAEDFKLFWTVDENGCV